jgi:cobalt/nickel transport system permease protein
MHHSYLDHMAYREGPVHKLDPRAKLAATVAFAVAVALAPSGHGLRLGGLTLILGFAVLRSSLSVSYLLKRTALVLPFVGLVALAVPFTFPGDLVWSGRFLGVNGSVSRQGLLMAGTMVIKACLVAGCLLVLAATTRFNRLLASLRWYRLPTVFVMIFAFLYRYLFLVIDQSHHMSMARRSRCARRRPKGGLRSSGSMLTNLAVRSFDRAERVHRAMVARGHDGRIRTLEPLRGGRWDLVLCLGFSVAGLAISLLPWPEVLAWTP